MQRRSDMPKQIVKNVKQYQKTWAPKASKKNVKALLDFRDRSSWLHDMGPSPYYRFEIQDSFDCSS